MSLTIRYVSAWAPFQYKGRLFRYGIPILKMKWSWDRLIFLMGISVMGRRRSYISTVPRHWWFTKMHDEIIFFEMWCMIAGKKIIFSHCFLSHVRSLGLSWRSQQNTLSKLLKLMSPRKFLFNIHVSWQTFSNITAVWLPARGHPIRRYARKNIN